MKDREYFRNVDVVITKAIMYPLRGKYYKAVCPYCKGGGYENGFVRNNNPVDECSECKGKGYIKYLN